MTLKQPQKPKKFENLLDGNEIHDNQVRQAHHYPNTPSLMLATSIFDLCVEKRKVGTFIIGLCDPLSTSKLYPREIAIPLMEQLIQYAKLCFLKDPEGQGMISSCDTLLTHIELLNEIVNTTKMNISLSDLGNQSKAR